MNEDLNAAKRYEVYQNQRAALRELRAMRRYIVELVTNADKILAHNPDDRLARQQRGIAEQFADFYFDIDAAIKGKTGK